MNAACPAWLQGVGGDAEETNPERHRRVPRLVDDAIEVGIGEPGDVPRRVVEDVVEVAEQE